MTFTELVDAYIAHGESMMTADSKPEMREESDIRHAYVLQLREFEAQPGFPTPEDMHALARLREWEALHGVPPEEEA